MRGTLVVSAGLGLLVLGAFTAGIKAATAENPFIRPGDNGEISTARVETFEPSMPRGVQPLRQDGPLICRRFNTEFSRLGRVPANPCTAPLPGGDKDFARIAWTKLDPMTNLDLVKAWAFWQFWAIRSPNATLENSPDPEVREFLRRLSEHWSTPDTKKSMDPATTPWRTPPMNVSEAVEGGWNIYGARILAIIAREDFEIETADLDFNRDGKIDRLYRITQLSFGSNREPITGRPTLNACRRSSASDPRYTAGLYVSEADDPKLHRSLIDAGRLLPYDAFWFRNELYSASRPVGADFGFIGWLSKNEATSYLAWDHAHSEPEQPGISFLLRCQFNLNDVQPPVR